MKIVVGLGNPGEKYRRNRHNTGFIVLDEVVDRMGLAWEFESRFSAEVADVAGVEDFHRLSLFGGPGPFPETYDKDSQNVKFVKPQGFVNDSGRSVLAVVSFYLASEAQITREASQRSLSAELHRVDLNDLIVVRDDVDMEFGKIRFNKGHGSGGHKGVESVMSALGSKAFWQFKIGVGRPKAVGVALEDWVLSDFGDEELAAVKEISGRFLRL
ncbi:peptidyl-tRNA hydrolase [candidate division WWE3 bacterium]|nr:peptidyl-tRNA hydrolase [candidate division WWE3 bacterium]